MVVQGVEFVKRHVRQRFNLDIRTYQQHLFGDSSDGHYFDFIQVRCNAGVDQFLIETRAVVE